MPAQCGTSLAAKITYTWQYTNTGAVWLVRQHAGQDQQRRLLAWSERCAVQVQQAALATIKACRAGAQPMRTMWQPVAGPNTPPATPASPSPAKVRPALLALCLGPGVVCQATPDVARWLALAAVQQLLLLAHALGAFAAGHRW